MHPQAHWKEEEVQTVLQTHGNGKRDFFVDKFRFHIGDVTMHQLSTLLGSVMIADIRASAEMAIRADDLRSHEH